MNHLPSPISYREDINGLRAWAVIAVLLFHFSLIGLPGGFVGVDIFFVISGYLMTSIIISGHLKGNFSITKFYMARARRILPVLMVLVITLLMLGWFWLPTPDYQSLANQSIYGLTFSSNIHYWLTSGYFDSASHEKWLLHTWSLAVEAQFYVLYPILVALVWRFTKSLKIFTVVIAFAFVASLLLSVYVTSRMPAAAFYLLPTRAWELLAGGLVYLLAQQNFSAFQLKKYLYLIGWSLIFLSFIFIYEKLQWPSYWALIPVIGTSLVIYAHKENCFLTQNYVAQWLGDRSYSLYLWHWPIVVTLYFYGLHNDWTWVLVGFLLSLFLAHFSYLLIEVPTRQYLSKKAAKTEFIAIFLTLSILVVFILKFDNSVYINQNYPLVNIVANQSSNKNPRSDECLQRAGEGVIENGCFLGKEKDTVDLIVIGDSHANSLFSAIDKSASLNEKKYSFLLM